MFQSSKLSLRLWFLAIHLLSAAKTNLSALELKRHLGVCYRTAWRAIMQAMTVRAETRRKTLTANVAAHRNVTVNISSGAQELR